MCEKTLAGEFVPAVSTCPWLPCGSHTTPAADNAESTGLNSDTKTAAAPFNFHFTVDVRDRLNKIKKKKKVRISHHLTTVIASFTLKCVLHLKQWYCHLGLFWFRVCSHQLLLGPVKAIRFWERFMLPLMIGDASSPDICSWNSSVRLKLWVSFILENFSFPSIFLLWKIQLDEELRNSFLLWEGVQGYRAKSTSLVTVLSDPREQVDSGSKERFFTALSISQALVDVSNMCETTSPSAQAALFNDAPTRGPWSTKHDGQHQWAWLPSVTEVKKNYSSVTTVAPAWRALKPATAVSFTCFLCKSFKRAVKLKIISAGFTLRKGGKQIVLLCCHVGNKTKSLARSMANVFTAKRNIWVT